MINGRLVYTPNPVSLNPAAQPSQSPLADAGKTMGAPRHLVWVVAATMAGASNPVAIKLALSWGFPPFLLGFGRALCVGVFFAVWVRWNGGAIFGARGAQRKWVLLASVGKASAWPAALRLCR